MKSWSVYNKFFGKEKEVDQLVSSLANDVINSCKNYAKENDCNLQWILSSFKRQLDIEIRNQSMK